MTRHLLSINPSIQQEYCLLYWTHQYLYDCMNDIAFASSFCFSLSVNCPSSDSIVWRQAGIINDRQHSPERCLSLVPYFTGCTHSHHVRIESLVPQVGYWFVSLLGARKQHANVLPFGGWVWSCGCERTLCHCNNKTAGTCRSKGRWVGFSAICGLNIVFGWFQKR